MGIASGFVVLMLLMPCGRADAADEGEGLVRVLRPSQGLVIPETLGPPELGTRQMAQAETGIELGAKWLANQQDKDGSWSALVDAPAGFPGDPGGTRRVGVTALALSALMDAQDPELEERIHAGIVYLRGVQDQDGCIGPRPDQRYMFGHALGGYALARHALRTGDPESIQAVDRALTFTWQTRNPEAAWRYGIRPENNDIAVTAAMLLLPSELQHVNAVYLKHFGFDGYDVRGDDMASAWTWIDKAWSTSGRANYNDYAESTAGYTEVHGALAERSQAYPELAPAAMAAWASLVCATNPAKDRRLAAAIKLIEGSPPLASDDGTCDDFYYAWWLGHLLHRLDQQQRLFAARTKGLRVQTAAGLLARQVGPQSGGPRVGSWNPDCVWGAMGGRVYSTALAVSTIRRLAWRAESRLPPDASARVEATIQRARDEAGALSSLWDVVQRARASAFVDRPQFLDTCMRCPDPLVRLRVAEALAALDEPSASVLAYVGRALDGKATPEVRRELLLAALRHAPADAKRFESLVASQVPGSDGVQALLLGMARDALEKGLPAQLHPELVRAPNAHELTVAAQAAGLVEADPDEARTRRARWVLLHATGLAHQVSPVLGLRKPILAGGVIRDDAALTAVESFLSAIGHVEVSASEAFDTLRAAERVNGNETP